MKTDFIHQFKNNLFKTTPDNFEERALSLFRYQAKHNAVYSRYVNLLKKMPEKINTVREIPFLPIEFFKTNKIITGSKHPEQVFESSGTTSDTPSRHFVSDLSFYEKVSKEIFTKTYGPLNKFTFLALLPSYLERKNSSLVYMVSEFIKKSKSPLSGFFLDDFNKLYEILTASDKIEKRKTMLIGVTFALSDFAEQFQLNLKNTTIVETGGMKGRKREPIREEIHNKLKAAFGVNTIHSEYGMTELLSQAWSRGDGVFQPPPWMKILIREINDPFSYCDTGERGVVNLIDLANTDSCAFIATADSGRKFNDESFEILGRTDASEQRGCNLMLSEKII